MNPNPGMQSDEARIPDSSEDERVPDPREGKRKRIIITIMTVAFCAALLFLISRGGMCERYERKMERQRLMRDYIDSMRMESDKMKSH